MNAYFCNGMRLFSTLDLDTDSIFTLFFLQVLLDTLQIVNVLSQLCHGVCVFLTQGSRSNLMVQS